MKETMRTECHRKRTQINVGCDLKLLGAHVFQKMDPAEIVLSSQRVNKFIVCYIQEFVWFIEGCSEMSLERWQFS